MRIKALTNEFAKIFFAYCRKTDERKRRSQFLTKILRSRLTIISTGSFCPVERLTFKASGSKKLVNVLILTRLVYNSALCLNQFALGESRQHTGAPLVRGQSKAYPKNVDLFYFISLSIEIVLRCEQAVVEQTGGSSGFGFVLKS